MFLQVLQNFQNTPVLNQEHIFSMSKSENMLG